MTALYQENSVRNDEWRKKIVCDQAIHHGEPCIRGTRIAVAVVVSSLADVSMDQLLLEYPQISREDVQAALFYAAEAAHSTLVA